MPSIGDVVDSIAAQMPDIPVRLGEEFQQENSSPPRVVIVPREDTYLPPSPRDVGRYVAPSIRTRGVGLEARIWGASAEGDTASWPDYRATELLVDRVLLAIHLVCFGAVNFEGGSWMPVSAAQLGRVYVLRFRVSLPVVPTEARADAQATTFNEVLSPSSPEAIRVTVQLGADESGIPSP